MTAVAGLLALLPQAARAQTVLTGRVTGNGEPVLNAEVLVDSLRTRTAANGQFVLHVSGVAQKQVAVRALGFQPAVATVSVGETDTTVVHFTLSPVVQTLDSVTVRAAGVATSPKMMGFEQRRTSGFGHFITREELARLDHSVVSNVLRRANVRLVPRPVTCGGGYAVATARGGSSSLESYPCSRLGGDRVPPACYAPIYLDGVPMWGPGWGPPPNVDEFKPVDLEGVEVYRSWVEAPLQFQQFRSPCGVVLFWTRTGHKR